MTTPNWPVSTSKMLRGALALGSVLFVLLLLELVLRALGTPHFSQQKLRTRYDEFAFVVADALPGESGPPHTSTHFYHYPAGHTWYTRYPDNPRGYFEAGARVRYALNAEGFRGDDFPLEPTGFRVALVGDSITLGEGVHLDDTFGRRIERALREIDPRSDVLNFGVNGFSTAHEAVMLERVVAPYEPDVVVLGYTLNDIDGNPFGALNEELEDLSSSLPWIDSPSHAINFISRPFWSRSVANRHRDLMLSLYESDAWNTLASQLGAMARLCRVRGWTLIAVVFPDLSFLGEPYAFDAIHRKLAALFGELGVTSIDLTAMFRERGAAELRVHAMDAHPNEIGHAFAADALMPVLAPLAKVRSP